MDNSQAWQQNVNKSIDTYKGLKNFEKPYRRYDFVYEKIKDYLADTQSFLDIGCGDGSFIYYLKQRHPEISYHGVEYSEDLLNDIRNNELLKGVDFSQGDAVNFELGRKFDHALMAGVLSIFDDIEKPIKNMCEHIKSGGYGFIFGCVNEKDIDLLVRFKNNFKGSETWESGINLFSLNTIKKELAPYVDDISVHKFEIDIDLPESEDPISSHTINMADGSKLTVNGANVVYDYRLIIFKKK